MRKRRRKRKEGTKGKEKKRQGRRGVEKAGTKEGIEDKGKEGTQERKGRDRVGGECKSEGIRKKVCNRMMKVDEDGRQRESKNEETREGVVGYEKR